MAGKTCTGGDWSFSLRSNACRIDASSSDDDSDDDKPAQISSTGEKTSPSEEARLLGELDLASRMDAASYKPNPWTIAKANAAARAPQPSLPPPKMAGRKYTPGQRTVLDLLRAQPIARQTTHVQQTEPSITRCIDEPPMVTSSKPLSPDRLLGDPHIPSDDTLVDVAPSDSGTFSKLSDDNSTISPSSCLLSPSRGGTLRKPVIVDSASTSGSDTMVPEAHQSHPYPLVQSPSPDGSPRMWKRAEEDYPPLSGGISSGRELRSILFISKQPSGAALNKPSISRSSQLRHQVAISPPITAYSHFSGSVPNVAAGIPAAMLPRSSNIVSGFKPLEPIVSPRIGSLLHRSPHRSSSQSSPFPNNVYSPPTQEFESCPASSPGPINGVHRTYGQRASRQELALNRFAFQPSQPPLSYAHPEASRQSSPSPSPPSSRPLPESDVTHGSRALRLSAASDGQPPPRKPRERDAYEAFSSPDSSWTTVPAAKKRIQKRRERKSSTTTNFKLPLRTVWPLSGLRKREDNEFGARAAKSRTVTYLPPPPTVHPSGQDDDVTHEIRSLSSNTPRSNMPQYGQNTSPPTFRPMAIRRATSSVPLFPDCALKPPEALDSGRPSPRLETTCDPGNSTTLAFNGAGLRGRYRLLRRRIAKRKRLSTEVWDMLELPSCGVVFNDAWRGVPRQGCGSGGENEVQNAYEPDACGREMRIISWPASRGVTRPAPQG